MAQLFAAVQLVLVTCGYLAVLSIVLSTNSAHATAAPATPVPASPASHVPAVALDAPASRRRRRQLRKQEQQRPQERAASYSRFSSGHQREDSIVTQQHRCREAAEGNGHTILPDMEYSDERISGTKRNRGGLTAMMESAARGEFNVLYVFSLSRLARESIITMPLLKRLVHVHHVRFISITEGIDSERDGWEFIASFMSLVHEHYIKALSNDVLRGQEGILLNGFSVGDWCLGYGSEPVPGTEVKRQGRESKPRMAYKIDLETAAWVLRIFKWFEKDRQAIGWIVRELNRQKAPKDHRSTTPHWNHSLVVGLLQNLKYVGVWHWGQNYNERDPETGDIRQLPRADEECAQWTRHRPDLQIIDDETFEKTQKLLQENADKYASHRTRDGRLRGSSSGNKFGNPTYLVSGLFECSACGHRLVIGGSKSKFLFCPSHKKGICNCKTQLPLQLAQAMILDVVGKRVLTNEMWFEAVWVACQQEWEGYCNSVPAEIQEVERELAEVDRKLQRLVDRLEDGDDSPEIAQRCAQRRAQRVDLTQRLRQLQQDAQQHPEEPTEDWLRTQLTQLGETLRDGTPAAAHALRSLVGGKIVVEEVQKSGLTSYFWRGTFRLEMDNVCQAMGVKANVEGCSIPESSGDVQVLDFVARDSQEELMHTIRQLHEEEYLGVEIGQILGISRSWVTTLLTRSLVRDGKTPEDGRRRRHQLNRVVNLPSPAERLSQQAKDLWDQDLPMQEIAQRLDVDISRVTAAIKFWFASRGLPVPDGRARRREIRLRNRSGA
ncbi:MAG: recombinase family protein [Planctomycetaceae bacterium]|nr:recombinase family protein [Planctomycetaceae bacterium]